MGEIEEATRDFLNGDILEWANDCNNGLIPQEDLWKKEIFTLWKVHKETHKVVELKIDDRYYWLDGDFKNEVNETYGCTYTKERQYWREEDIPKRSSDTDSEFSFMGQNKPFEAGYSSFPTDDLFTANSGPIMDFNGFCEADEKSDRTLSSPTAQTREFIEKVFQPCEPSLLAYSNDVMNYILKAEGVDGGAVMRHNRFLLYSDYQRTQYWYHVSQRTKWAANFKCSKCGRKEDLQAHHLTYEHRGLEAKYPEDLICLCKRCHMEEHESENKQGIDNMASEY